MTTNKQKVDKVPNLRFPGFEGEWERKKMGEIAQFSKGKGISKAEIDENGKTECIRYGELYTTYNEIIDTVISKTNTELSKLILSEENDIIIPASGETQIDIATASCVMKSGIALGGDLNIIKTPLNGIFLSYYLNSKKKMEIANLAQGISVVHLYSSQLSTLEINYPSSQEQSKIAGFLSLCETRIQQSSKIIEGLKSFKSEVINKIFRQQLRFKDDSGNDFPDWQTKKIGDITTVVNNRNKNNEKLPVYSINNKLGFVPQNVQFEGIDSDSRGYDIQLYKIINKNTFAYNPARINVGSIGYSGNLENIIVSSLYVCFKADNSINDYFLFYYLKTELFNKDVLKNVEGGVRDYLFYENFARIIFSIPCVEEQTRIASFLSSIDEKIETENQILNQYKNQKAYLLQNMFV